MSLERMFDVVEGLRKTASAEAAFGEPQVVEGRVLIPVAEVGAGFGLGFGQGMSGEGVADAPQGEESPEGGGAGGGAKARPVAVIEVTADKTVVTPVMDEGKIALAGILLVGWIAFVTAVTVRAILRPR